jgi:DNA-binding GntR family transcriptional regulator
MSAPIADINESVRDATYLRLRKALMTGFFAPGQRVTIRAVAAALGVSATPVREALRELISEGALEVVSQRIVQVPDLTEDRLREITQVRVLNEGLAAHEAAKLISAAELSLLGKLNDQLAEARDRSDFATYLTLNEHFHFAIYQASRMPILLSLIEKLWLRSGPYLAVLLPQMRGLQHHEDAIRALQSRNGSAARDAIRKDIEMASRHLLRLVGARTLSSSQAK